MRRWILGISLATGVVVGASIFASWWALRQTQYVPEFYSQAEKELPHETREASQRLSEDVVRLKDDAAKVGSWQAIFSDHRINAWLVEEFPKKFPSLFARGASNPRVVIEDGRVLVAARYKDHRIETVISCEVSAELTEEPNLIALRVNNLRAGALPIPLQPFMNGITHEAASGDVKVQWDMTDSGPVALVTIPSEHDNYVCSPVIVESLQFFNGQAWLAGHTGPLAHQVFAPDGPLYQFVSYRQPESRNQDDPAALPSRATDRRRSMSSFR